MKSHFVHPMRTRPLYAHWTIENIADLEHDLFDDKDELVEAIVDDFMQQIQKEVEYYNSLSWLGKWWYRRRIVRWKIKSQFKGGHCLLRRMVNRFFGENVTWRYDRVRLMWRLRTNIRRAAAEMKFEEPK